MTRFALLQRMFWLSLCMLPLTLGAAPSAVTSWDAFNEKHRNTFNSTIVADKPMPVTKEQLAEINRDMDGLLEKGVIPSGEQFEKLYGVFIYAASLSTFQNHWPNLRNTLDRLGQFGELYKFENNLKGHLSTTGSNCKLSDPNPTCLFSFGNFGSESSPGGNCRGYSEALIFINNNFSFKRDEQYKKQCPLPETVCQTVFGSYQSLLYPKDPQVFDQFFTWNSESCTYEIPCFENLSQLSKSCFKPQTNMEKVQATHPTVLFQNLVSSFQRNQDDSPLDPIVLGKKNKFKAKLLDFFGIRPELVFLYEHKLLNPSSWPMNDPAISDSSVNSILFPKKLIISLDPKDVNKRMRKGSFPMIAGVSNRTTGMTNHAIIITGYNKINGRIQAIDSNHPNQVVEIVEQGGGFREVYKKENGAIEAQPLRIFDMSTEALYPWETLDPKGYLKFKTPFYSTVHGKPCKKLR